MTITIGTGVLVGNGVTIDGPVTVTLNGTTASQIWTSVAFGGNVYVGVSQNSNVGCISTDGGLSWNPTSLATSTHLFVEYGNGYFVAVGSSTQAERSSDGVTWTAVNLPSTQGWNSVAYGNGRWVAVATSTLGGNTNKYATSDDDGATWTDRTWTGSSAYHNIVFGNGKFVATNGSSSYVSTDGLTWSSGSMGGTNYRNLTYGNGKFVAVSQGGGVKYSTDGLTWSNGTSAGTYTWQGVGYGNGVYVATAQGTSKFMWSTDAITWTLGQLPFTDTSSIVFLSVAYGPGMYQGFVTLGYEFAGPGYDSKAAVSRDGINWY